MKTVSLSKFRNNCSTFLKLAKKTGERIQVTRFGRPIADIIPPGLTAKEREDRITRDVEILNRFADELNKEASDGLDDQPSVFYQAHGKAGKHSGRRDR